MEFPRKVYAIRNNVNGKVYVGSTSDITRRIAVHFSMLKAGNHINKAMQEDYNQLGGDLTVFLLDEITGMADRNKEYLWMDALCTRDPGRGYNDKDNSRPASLLNKPVFCHSTWSDSDAERT